MKSKLNCNLQHQLLICDNRRDPGLRLLLLDQPDLLQVLHVIGDIFHVPLDDARQFIDGGRSLHPDNVKEGLSLEKVTRLAALNSVERYSKFSLSRR